MTSPKSPRKYDGRSQITEHSHDDGRCCEGGYFGQTHDCRKGQPFREPNETVREIDEMKGKYNETDWERQTSEKIEEILNPSWDTGLVLHTALIQMANWARAHTQAEERRRVNGLVTAMKEIAAFDENLDGMVAFSMRQFARDALAAYECDWERR